MAVEEVLAYPADWPASQTSTERNTLPPHHRVSDSSGIVRITAVGLLVPLVQLLGCGGDVGPMGPTVVASVEVTPASDTLTALGDTCRFTAVARASNGDTISGQTFTWVSSAPEVASVSVTTGKTWAEGNGTAMITAATAGLSGSASVTVGQLAAVVEMWPAETMLRRLGVSLLLYARAYDANGTLLAEPSFDWSSSDSSVATVVEDPANSVGPGVRVGVVISVGPGKTTITAGANGVTANALVTVDVGEFASVSAGDQYTCGATAGGVAYCWGANTYGQLGDGTTVSNRLVPAKVSGGLSFASVSASFRHTCGVTSGGVAHCWGAGAWGKLGDGTRCTWLSPVEVYGGLNFTSVSAGTLHTCGLTTGGFAYCWGRGDYGQLGDGAGMRSDTPVAVSGGLSFASVSAGGQHTCGVTIGGVAYCWGGNYSGQLGEGFTGIRLFTPVEVSGGLSFASVSAGTGHTCGVTTGGVAYCWGSNGLGQLGDGSLVIIRNIPVAVYGGLSFASVSTGKFHTCGVTSGGVAYCWGDNRNGELGDGTTVSNRVTPVAVTGGLTFVSVSAGYRHTCGVTTDWVAYCWGENAYGQLGDATTSGSSVPMRVKR